MPTKIQTQVNADALNNAFVDFLGADASVKGQAYTQAAQSAVQAIDQISSMPGVSSEVKARLAELRQEIAPNIDSRKDVGDNRDVLALSTRFLNKMDPLWKNTAKIEPIEGYQDIVCHGDTVSLIYRDSDGNENNVPVREFTEILKNSPVYEGGPIRLISCETGADGLIVAQAVADHLGVEVLAPTDVVYVYPDGKIVIGPDRWTNTGTWKLFSPIKK